MSRYSLFKSHTEGVQIEVALEANGEELDLVESAESKLFIVQHGKIYEVGKEE
jgi:hypothetical protein